MAAAAFSIVVVGGCRSDVRLCGGEHAARCHCQGPDNEWAIDYKGFDTPLSEGQCELLGGHEESGGVGVENVEGLCVGFLYQSDECEGPSYVFYEKYSGSFLELETLEEVRAACDLGEIVEQKCALWKDPEDWPGE